MKLPKQFLYKPPGYGDLGMIGNNGAFIIPHYKIIGYEFRCIASDDQAGWEHVSVTVSPISKAPSRCPTWDEMCFIKDLFWNDDQEVIQFHPKKDDYVSFHNYCLHLWYPINQTFNMPTI